MSKPQGNLTAREKTLQVKEIKDLLKIGVKMDPEEQNSALAKKLISFNNPMSTSIIRIVPGDLKRILVTRKSASKQVAKPTKPISIPEQVQSSLATSSSTELTDHCYLKKLKPKKLPSNEASESTIESLEHEDFAELIQFNNSDTETKDSEIKNNPLKRILKTDVSPIPEKIQKVHSEQCCCSCRETLDIILQQQQEILKMLRKDYSSPKKLDLLPNMPFDDMNDFLDFDESLTHENVRDQFMIKMKKLLVNTDQKSVSNVMSSIVTNELCRNITWIGVKNSLAFGTTNMVEMIVEGSRGEEQQPGASRAAVSDLLKIRSNSSDASGRRTLTPTAGSSEEADDSFESDDNDEDRGGEDDAGEDDVDGDEEEEDDDDDDDEEDPASVEDNDNDDEYVDELHAVAAKSTREGTSTDNEGDSMDQSSAKPTDKEVSDLLEFKRRKKTGAVDKATKDKRMPTVKKELSTQKELLMAENETQLQVSQPEMLDHIPEDSKNEIEKNELQDAENYEDVGYGEQLPAGYDGPYTVLTADEALKRLSKRHSLTFDGLQSYLLQQYLAEREKLRELGSEEGLLAESLLKLLAKLAENPQRWERIHQLLTDIKADLDYSRRSVEAQKRLVQVSLPLSTTSRPPSATLRPSKKPRKKKKKKKPHQRKQSASTTIATIMSTTEPNPTVMATTQSTASSTRSTTSKWKLVAEKLFGSHWMPKDDESDVARVRFSVPSKPRTMSSLHRPLDDKEQESLKVLNSERQALMLKAAREYAQPRLMHFGKINTHQQTLSSEDLEDDYEPSQRTYHFGQLVSPLSSRLSGHPRPREHIHFPDQQQAQHRLGLNFGRDQDYLPPAREVGLAANKPWQESNDPTFRYNPWAKLGEPDERLPPPPPKNTWDWRQYPNSPAALAKPWLPWHGERDYFARLEEEEEEETAKAWQQAQQRQQQNWNRQNLRDNLSSWLEGKEVHRIFQTPASWPLPEKSRDYSIQREQNVGNWENSRNNNSNLKNEQPKQEDDSKESPKLTMKTWTSLTSDPATWPYKLPGAKPWPKDENGKSYNPNAELVRKLGLYQNGNLRTDKDPMKDLKQQKLQKNENASSKVNSWVESDSQHPNWYNGLHDKLRENGEADSSSNEHNNHWNNREKVPEDWNGNKASGNSGNTWPPKWKQFAYHKVTAQPTSKSGMTLDKPNSFIAVSDPRYDNAWRKNDIEDIGPNSDLGSGSEDPDHPANQMRMNVWKKSGGTNATNHSPRIDILKNQLEDLKDKDQPVMLEVNVSIKNSTSHHVVTLSPSSLTVTEEPKVKNITSQDLNSARNH